MSSAHSPLSSPRMSRGASPGGSPGGSPRSDNKGPSALRNELAAAKKAVEVLKMEKDATQEKLEKLHGVLETERSALREVLQAARKAVDDLKVEKQEVEDNLTKEQETTKWQAEEIERLKRLLSSSGDSNQQINILNQQISSLTQQLADSTRMSSSSHDDRQTISDLQAQLTAFQQNAGNQAGNADEQLRLAKDQVTNLEMSIERIKKEHQFELDKMSQMRVSGSDDAKTRQLEALHKKNLMKLSSVQRECGIRWMNHILARHRLHNNVGAFIWWRCYANGKIGSGMTSGQMSGAMEELRQRHSLELQQLNEQKDEELKAQLAQAGRGLKRWMEDREQDTAMDVMRRKAQAVKMLCKVLAQWAAGSITGCVIQWKLNFADSTTDNLTDRYNAAMVAKLRQLRRQSAVLAMKEIITRWMNTEQNVAFMRWQQNFQADHALKKLMHLEGQAKDAGMAGYWKDEAERVAALFDRRKAAFEATQHDHEYHRKDLQERHDSKLAELAKCQAELDIAVGDLAHQMNQSETDRQNSARLTEINLKLENVVRVHVVEGAVMRGKLGKQGSVLSSSVNQRWCVLDARQLSLFEDQSEQLAKTVIPIKDIEHIKADPDFKKYGFAVTLKDSTEARDQQKTATFKFEANSSDDLTAWVDNLTKLQGSQGALDESWDMVRSNYVDQIKIEQDRLQVAQQNYTTYKTDSTQIADGQLQALEEKYEALLKCQAKIDDDIWMWVERHMWQQTSAQGLGFGEQKMAQALGGTGGIPCHIATNWTDRDGANCGAEINEECSGANDGKNTTYTVNFEAPSDMEQVVAVVKISKQQVTAAPPVPIKDPKEEVKKLQRLMVLRNPSPPRSRQRMAGDHSASPRGKSPPKKRGTGSISSSPRASRNGGLSP